MPVVKKKVKCSQEKGASLRMLYNHRDAECQRKKQLGNSEAIRFVMPFMWNLIWSRIRDREAEVDDCIDDYMMALFDCQSKSLPIPQTVSDKNLYEFVRTQDSLPISKDAK